MPHKKILQELGMTALQWGLLPIETESPIRNELKEKAAVTILSRERTNSRDGLADRIANLEKDVSDMRFAMNANAADLKEGAS